MLTQYMTYPYNFNDPKTIRLWAPTDPHKVVMIMDGMEVDMAHYHFTYGSNWPLLYVQASQKSHPNFQYFESDISEPELTVDELGYPSTISLRNERQHASMIFNESFGYDDQHRITSYESHIKRDFGPIEKEMKEKLNLSTNAKVNLKKYDFQYDQDLLLGMTKSFESKEHQYTFQYVNRAVSGSSFFIDGKKYHHRKYFYNDQGLKDRTEIYNSYGELEYEIFYSYEYY